MNSWYSGRVTVKGATVCGAGGSGSGSRNGVVGGLGGRLLSAKTDGTVLVQRPRRPAALPRRPNLSRSRLERMGMLLAGVFYPIPKKGLYQSGDFLGVAVRPTGREEHVYDHPANCCRAALTVIKPPPEPWHQRRTPPRTEERSSPAFGCFYCPTTCTILAATPHLSS